MVRNSTVLVKKQSVGKIKRHFFRIVLARDQCERRVVLFVLPNTIFVPRIFRVLEPFGYTTGVRRCRDNFYEGARNCNVLNSCGTVLIGTSKSARELACRCRKQLRQHAIVATTNVSVYSVTVSRKFGKFFLRFCVTRLMFVTYTNISGEIA